MGIQELHACSMGIYVGSTHIYICISFLQCGYIYGKYMYTYITLAVWVYKEYTLAVWVYRKYTYVCISFLQCGYIWKVHVHVYHSCSMGICWKSLSNRCVYVPFKWFILPVAGLML